jgi:hypothetical protein
MDSVSRRESLRLFGVGLKVKQRLRRVCDGLPCHVQDGEVPLCRIEVSLKQNE